MVGQIGGQALIRKATQRKTVKGASAAQTVVVSGKPSKADLESSGNSERRSLLS